MRKYFLKIFPYIIFLAASLIPFLIYGKHVINSPYVNNAFPNFQLYLETWTNANKGSFTYFFIPFDIVIYYLMKIMPQAIIIQLSDAIIIFLALVTSYHLGLFLFRNKTISIIAGFIYSYSIYGQFMSGWTVASGSIIFALAPFFVYKFLSIKKTSNILKEACLLGLLSFLLINVNLTFIIYLNLLLFSILLYHLVNKHIHIFKKSAAIFFIYLGLYLSSNSVFFFSFGANYFYQKSDVTNQLAAENVGWKSGSSYLHELFRQMGALNYYYRFLDQPAYPNAQIYNQNILFILLSFCFPILALIGVIVKNTNKEWKKFKVFLLILLILSLFMGMGVFQFSPTKPLYEFLLKVIPYFVVFRDTYKVMFIINLIYMILICYIFFYLQQKNTKYIKFAYPLIAILILLNSIQFWSGNFLQQEFISVPQYWYDLHQYYAENGDNNSIIFLPNIPFPAYTFVAWRGKSSTFYRPLINYNQVNNINMINTVNTDALGLLYKNYKNTSFSPLLGFYGIKYTLLQYDVDWQAYHADNPAKIEKNLDKNLKLVKTFQ